MMRFVVLPGDNRFNFGMSTPSLAALGGGMAAASAFTAGLAALTPVDSFGSVLSTIGDRDALLVSLDDPGRLALQRTYPGLQVVKEGTAHMAMVPQTLLPIPSGGMAGVTTTVKGFEVTVTEPGGKPVKGVLVSVLTDLTTTPATGAQAKTNASGVARFQLPGSVKIVRILAEAATRHWPSSWSPGKGKQPGKLTLICRLIDPLAPDGLRCLHPAGQAGDGTGVTVAVIDGGASHHALKIKGGKNLAPGEADHDLSDNGMGHGTHVAGIIAAQPGDGNPGGLAPGVALLVYRVYTKGSTATGTFAVAAAIRQAIDAGADLINLSLYLRDDTSVAEREIKRARANGALCIAAAGNTHGPVEFPARFSNVAAVSAIGVRDSWPKEAHRFDLLGTPKAKKNKKIGVARFSCHGPEVDFAAPGVGVVSLMPVNTVGVMIGTSMSAPAITGLVARKLALDADLRNAPRNQNRSDKIMAMATDVAKSVGLPAEYEGHGILGS